MDSDVETGRIEKADDLRQVLRRAELAIADLRVATPEEALGLLHMIDVVEVSVLQLESQLGVDLKPERTRLATLENMLRSRARLLVRRAGADRLRDERERLQPADDAWWWHLDLITAGARQRQLRRAAIYAIAATAVLLVASVAYSLFLAPSPEERAFTESLSQGEQSLLRGELEAALPQYEAAATLRPDDPDPQLYLGVIYEQMGRQDDASKALAQAERLSPSEVAYYSSLSLVYYRVAANGDNPVALAGAEEAAVAAVSLDDGYALAHFALASVYELQGRNQEAIAEFELASQLSSNASLTVLARMRMGMLMQRPSGQVPESSSTPVQ